MFDPPCEAGYVGNANAFCTAQAPSRQILLIAVSFVVVSRARLLGANDSAVKFRPSNRGTRARSHDLPRNFRIAAS
jgi:hypothetical protein